MAGVPSRFAAHVDVSFKKTISSDSGTLLLHPMRPGTNSPTYSLTYRSELLEKCASWASERAADEDFSIILLFSRNDKEDSASLLADFFPFALAYGFESLRDVGSLNEIRRELKKLANALEPICARLRSSARTLHGHLASRVRHTPLLLPVKNFGSAVVKDTLEFLQQNAIECDPLDEYIKLAIKIINDKEERVHMDSEGRRRKERELFYVNEDGLMFRTPNYDQFHGFPRLHGHPPTCYLKSRTRVGSSFNPRFHYDCKPHRGRLKSEYDSCHDVTKIGAKENVNIAPSDFVRA